MHDRPLNPMQLATQLLALYWLLQPVYAYAGTLVCAVDLNGDGYIDQQSEEASCSAYPATSCATIQQVCTASSSSCATVWAPCEFETGGNQSVPAHTDTTTAGSWTCEDDPAQACTLREGYTGQWCQVADPGCTPTTTYSCPGNAAQACYASGSQQVCEVPDPSCQSGTAAGDLCPLQATACMLSPAGTYACPLGSQYACLGAAGMMPMCSANACVDASDPGGTTTPPLNDPTPVSNAPIDSTGCTASIRIFPGRRASCRGAGVETFFQDCCQSSVTGVDTMGAPGEPSQAQSNESNSELASALGYQCGDGDSVTAMQRQSGDCHYVGDYCAESWPLIGCVQQAHSYCCFNSMLARIIQEAAREQLPEMGGFGTPGNPNCRGFSVQEFQAIDFSKIDLSSYYTELRYASQSQIQQDFHSNVPGVGP